MVLITIVNGVYKPTYNWGGHIVYIYIYIQLLVEDRVPSDVRLGNPLGNEIWDAHGFPADHVSLPEGIWLVVWNISYFP